MVLWNISLINKIVKLVLGKNALIAKDQFIYDLSYKRNIIATMRDVNSKSMPIRVLEYQLRSFLVEELNIQPSVPLWNHMIDHDTDIGNINWGADDVLAMMYESMMFSDKKSKYIPKEVLNGIIYVQN